MGGSSKGGYGGDGGMNYIVERLFECIMALALCFNTFFALFSAVFWILSLFWSTNHDGFAFYAGKVLVYLTTLVAFIPLLIIAGVFLGIYLNLSPHLPETIVTLILVAIVVIVGQKRHIEFELDVAPLECYHAPRWFHEIMFPVFHSSKVKSRVKAAAKMRANELRKRAYSQRKVLDLKKRNNTMESNDRTSSLGILLQKAAANCDRQNADVSSYEACLEEDWITKPEQLKGVSIDYLIQFMPLGLAREVYKLLNESEEGN